jgi:hypothetical protein
MEATFENEKFGKEKLELFVFVVVFVVFETEKYERCEFQYEAGIKTPCQCAANRTTFMMVFIFFSKIFYIFLPFVFPREQKKSNSKVDVIIC